MSDSQPKTDDRHDRLTDRVLAEAVGGETPPDLSEAIVSRADEQQVKPADSGRSRRVWFTLLATAASLMLAVFLWPAQKPREEWRVALQDKDKQQGQIDTFSSSSMNWSADSTTDDIGERLGRASRQAEYLEAESEISSAVETAPAVRYSQTEGYSSSLSPADKAKLAKSQRRPGTSTVYNAGPADGPAPAPSYQPATETLSLLRGKRGLDAKVPGDRRQTMGRAAQPTAGVPVQALAMEVEESISSRGRFRSEGQFAGSRYGGGVRNFDWRPELPSRDQYAAIQENDFIKPLGENALSTFSIDVDTASYSNVRQYLMDQRHLPPADAVRVEELVNYFEYGYAGPDDDSEDPFAASMEVAPCPWKPEHRLVRIGIKGREVEVDKRPLSNLVFLVDVSGSMNDRNKLPLVIAGLKALTERLGENDRVAIVVYAGSQGVVLPSTSGEQKDEIRSALGRLQAGGSTAGGAGLKLAYEIAERHQIPGGVNRVVLCTDGDFNVGLTGTEELAKLVETRAKETKVFLTVLGFGRGNLNDAMLEAISGRGDGHYAYIDNEKEARRVLSRNLSGTLVTIAKDVKLQVEFNPAKVASYRLIGYENRVLAAKDFNDDTKDAGEIGAGHTVTALYEVVPVGVGAPAPPVDGLKYQTAAVEDDAARVELTLDAEGEPLPVSTELLTLKIRYKQPEGGSSKKLEFPLESDATSAVSASEDFRWAAAVAEFGMRLRGSQHAGDGSFDTVLERARGAIGTDEGGYRAEFIDIVRRASELSGR